jgi:hypothetical protein
MALEPPKTLQVPTSWVGAEELPVHFANTFLGVVAPGEIFLNIGSIMPPAIIGTTPEERDAHARSIRFVAVRPIARLGLTPARLDELIKTLEDTRANYNRLMAAIDTTGDTE